MGDQGQLQAFRAGESSGLYYYPFNHEGDAGFFLAMRDGVTPPVYGFDGSAGPHGLADYTLVSQSAVTGNGSAASPLTLVTKYDTSSPLLHVTQTTTYVNGTQQFTVRWDVQNASGGTVHFKALAAADFFFEGSDRGTGIFTQGPPRFIGGTNADTGRSGGFAGDPRAADQLAGVVGLPGTRLWQRPHHGLGQGGGGFGKQRCQLRQHRRR